MKTKISLALCICMLMPIFGGMIALTEDTVVEKDALVSYLASQFIDDSYWTSSEYAEMDTYAKSHPIDSDIPQREALDIAVTALLNLKWETPETLIAYPRITFIVQQEGLARSWLILIWPKNGEGEPTYDVKINTLTGDIRKLHIGNRKDFRNVAMAERQDVDFLVNRWNSITPMTDPSDKDSSATIPTKNDLSLDNALRIAFSTLASLRQVPAEFFEHYTVTAMFHNYPYLGRMWELTFTPGYDQRMNPPVRVRIWSPDGIIVDVSEILW